MKYVFNLAAIAVICSALNFALPLSADCFPDGAPAVIKVEKETIRTGGNTMLGRARAYADWPTGGQWYGTVNAEFWFRPAGGRADILIAGGASGSDNNRVYGRGDTRNPSVFWTTDLESRGEGSYFVRGSGAFACSNFILGVLTGDSTLHPVQRPAISGLDGVRWLGGLSDPDHGYYNAVRLTANSNRQPEDVTIGTPEWSVTQNPEKIGLSCSTCAQVDATSKAPSVGCVEAEKVKLRVSYSGFLSPEFTLTVNQPDYLLWQRQTDVGVSRGPEDDGFLSRIEYVIVDECGCAMSNIKVNENFTVFGSDYPGEDWPEPVESNWSDFQDPPFKWLEPISN